MIVKFDITKAAKEKILIVAHRGVSGGNIPCNTIPAFEIALKQGADMLEIDVEMNAEGKLYIFHPKMEPRHLDFDKRICHLTSNEIEQLRYVNYDRAQTQFGINTLDDFLETFKNRCYINVDKFWGHPQEIYETIKRHGMTEQIIVKSKPSEKVFQVLEELAPELPYMAIARDTHPTHELLLHSNINYVGVEVLFEKEDAEVACADFIDKIHRDNKFIWVNAIIYDHKVQLTGGHSDDTALCSDADLGWGWLVKRGFDLIQTDWPLMLKNYLQEKNLLYKN